MKCSLHIKTLELLKDKPSSLNYDTISLNTGLSVAWIKKFARGIHEPSVSKVQKLYEYLIGRELNV